MISFRRLLTLSYLAIVGIGIAAAAPLAWLALEQSYLDTQSANLLAQATLIAQALRSDTQPPASTLYSQSSNLLPGVHTHIIESPESGSPAAPQQPLPEVYTSMIAEDGPVVIGLQIAPPVAQQVVAPLPALAQNASGSVSPLELLSRTEVAEAFSGQPSTAVRTIADGQRVLYAAAPIVSAGGEVSRIVYIATPLPRSGWAALSPASRWQIAGVVVLVIALTAALGWRFSAVLARSLSQIVAAAGQVAAGDLNSHLPASSRISDLRSLSHAFNEMTESLRRADQAKTAFVADVSHELRTPLTVIKGTVETLQDGALNDLEARDTFLASIGSETERLIDLVNGLLTLARADAGALKIKPVPLDLVGLVHNRAGTLRGIAARKEIALRVSVKSSDGAQPQPACCVMADPERITQVLNNLLDNAIRYSPSGGEVQLVITPGPAQVTCSVVDSGPGIAAVHLPLLFNRFYRVEASRSRSTGGSGLGLAISREIIEAHGGSIHAQSVEGKGTTVSFTLPATPNCP